MAEQWYFDLGEDEQGPISSGELRQLVADQTINSETLVWKEGMEDWVPASRIKGLFSEKSSSASPPRRKAAPAPSSQGREKAYCRACGNEVGVEAVACLSCGLEPTNGSDFCGSCGADTNPDAVACIKCGVALKTGALARSSAGGGDRIAASDPPKDPVLMGILSGCLITGLGQLLLGQAGKGIAFMLGSIVLGVMTFGISFVITLPFCGIDAYLIAKKLKEGKTVGQWECF
jgi:TM2 domain-containing membrane protein YozV/ribosomal protein L40E